MKTTAPNPWEVSTGEFPADGTMLDKWHFFLRYAILAPSSHNTQPWLFHPRYTMLDIYADRRRSCPVVDPHGRELVMSCGCALFHLRCALRHFRSLGHVEILPDPHPDLMARIHIGPLGESHPEDGMLFESIPIRHTNRQPFNEEPVPDSLLESLRMAVEDENAWMVVLSEESVRVALAKLIAEADRIQWNNKSFRRELAGWLRPNDHLHGDGIPGYAVGVDDLLSYAGPLVVRTFNMGAGEAARDEEIALGSPALIVIGTDHDDMAAWMSAGQALDRVLLRARADNVWASFLSQPIEVPKLRSQLPEVIGHKGYVQAILRLGFAEAVRPTPRRSIDTMLL